MSFYEIDGRFIYEHNSLKDYYKTLFYRFLGRVVGVIILLAIIFILSLFA